MGRSINDSALHCYDSQERINRCLNCGKPRCDLCHAARGRHAKGVIGIGPDGEELHFQGTREAAEHFGVSRCSITQAIRSGGTCGGYLWTYKA